MVTAHLYTSRNSSLYRHPRFLDSTIRPSLIRCIPSCKSWH